MEQKKQRNGGMGSGAIGFTDPDGKKVTTQTFSVKENGDIEKTWEHPDPEIRKKGGDIHKI
jgi:hypothetical protein